MSDQAEGGLGLVLGARDEHISGISAGGSFSSVTALTICCLSVVAVLVLVLRPTTLRLPHGWSFPIPFYWMPVLGSVAMLCCLSMTWRDVGRGLAGDDRIKPYSIMLIFMCLAYIGASLDASGIFAYLALSITNRAKGRGRTLFVSYYLLSAFMTTFTSNDVAIVTLTPIIIYFSKAAKLDPLPFLMAEYAAGNIFGALLYVGNPTNIIVAQAYDMSFLGFSKIMTLPTLAAGVVALGVLWLQFRHAIPTQVALPALNPSDLLTDRRGALFGTINALSCLALLAAAPTLGWEMWAICVVCAAICLLYNTWALIIVRQEWRQWPWLMRLCGGAAGRDGQEDELCDGSVQIHQDHEGCGSSCGIQGSSSCTATPGPLALEPAGVQLQQGHSPAITTKPTTVQLAGLPRTSSDQEQMQRSTEGITEGSSGIHGPVYGATAATAATPTEVTLDAAMPAQGETISCERASSSTALTFVTLEDDREAQAEAVRRILGVHQATFMSLLTGLPWEVLPFALGFFVLVEGLSVNGWIDLFADGIGRASAQSLPAAIFLVGWLAVVLSNAINNQPMTIMMTRICLSDYFTCHMGSGPHHRAALFALVMASNIGALFTLIGALAGIMWSNIMRTKDLAMSYMDFLKYAPPVGLASMSVALLVIWFEFAVFPDEQ